MDRIFLAGRTLWASWLAVALLLLLTNGPVDPARAQTPASAGGGFHRGGVAACGGCHVMHESEDGVFQPDVSDPLLNGASATDICLSCHANGNGATGAVFGEDPLNPPPERGGGNFVFLLEDNLNDAPDGANNPIPGDAAGHNVVSPSMGVAADSRYPMAPGGSFPSAELGCTSCHDPHGNGNFRMLYGAGPIQGGLAVFTAPAPDAEAPAGGLGGAAESDDRHTAYRRGMSAWCRNCHGRIHDEAAGSIFEHPAGEQLTGDQIRRYDAYDGDADPTGGTAALAYLAAVPFEDLASTPSSTAGPTGASRVMCLSCHRAHASSAPHAGRWDFALKRLSDDGAASGSHPISSPYPDPEQGTLCHKCHEPEDTAPSGIPVPRVGTEGGAP